MCRVSLIQDLRFVTTKRNVLSLSSLRGKDEEVTR
jgi:hypothetical protein